MGVYYLDYLYCEVFLAEEDIDAVPGSGQADGACSAIADKAYVKEQFRAISCEKLKDAVKKLCDGPELRDRHDALMYIGWMVALGIKEERCTRHNSTATKTTNDGFVWLLVSLKQARKLWSTDVFTLYRLYPDGSEAQIETDGELEESIEKGYQIGIEVGYTDSLVAVDRIH